MKNYRNFIAALALALVLLTPTLAGDGVMHTGVVAPSPTPRPDSMKTADALDGKGVMHTGVAESAPSGTDITISDIAAALAQTVLILF